MSLNKESYLDPPEPEQHLYPVCGEDCTEIFTNPDNLPAGCENCIMDDFTKWDAGEWWAKEKEGREADEGDRKYHESKDQ